MYEIPDYKKSIGQNLFDITLGDQKYTVPKFDYLTPRQAFAFQDAETDPMGAYTVLDDISVPPGLGEILKDLPLIATTELVKAWSSDSGVTPGESGPSGA